MKTEHKRTIQIIIGISILMGFLHHVGFQKIWTTLQKIELIWVLPVFITYLLVHFLTAINYWFLLKAINQKRPWGFLFRAVILSRSISKVLPGKIGTFSIILFLKQKGIGYGQGLAVSLLDKIISFSALTLLALVGAALLLNARTFAFIFFICFSVLGCVIFIIVRKDIRQFVQKYFLKKYSQHFSGFYQTLTDVVTHKKVWLLLNVFNTLVQYVLFSLAYWFIFRAFAHAVPLDIIIFISAIVNLLSFIPITFAGLGIKEGTGAYMYNLFVGIELAVAANVMLLNRVIVYVLAFCFYYMSIDLINKRGHADV
jgi:hypothetical protein